MRHSFIKALCLTAVLTSFAVSAQKAGEYNFKYPNTPRGIDRYSTSVIGYDKKTIYTMNGTPMVTTSRPINMVKFNPSGAIFGVIGGEKGKNFLNIYRNQAVMGTPPLFKFPNKKYGNPEAFAFTPDGRDLLVATSAGELIEFNIKGRKFIPTDTIKYTSGLTDVSISSNAYYLAGVRGDTVEVFNLQEKKPRTTITLDSPVTDAMFNGDATELGVLTADGVFRTYDARTFLIKRSIDDLGQGIGFAFTDDGKYIAVVSDRNNIVVVNLVDPEERHYIEVPDGEVNDSQFLLDANRYTVLANTARKSLKARRMENLMPFYGKLVSTEADELMNEWMKMQPGESMEDYRLRVNAESIAKQRQLFEDEIATGFANNLLEMSTVSLGQYDARHELQEVNFTNMPSIYLPVPKDDKENFTDAANLQFRDVRYGIMPNDKFEMIYANVYNTADGKTYVFDNVNRAPLAFMQEDDDDPLTIEVIQQQQMEEMKLQEIKERVIAEAKKDNVISDHTNITVDSRIEPSFNANGDKILNYKVKFSYEVEPQFSAKEDFGPGKYHVNESGAATSMLNIVKEALEGDFAQYVQEGKQLKITLSGTADASPIRGKIAYDGSYGDIEDEPVTKDGQLTTITVTRAGGITENEQLAFLRAAGVQSHLMENIAKLREMNPKFDYQISVATGEGAEFRRITAEFTFIDVF